MLENFSFFLKRSTPILSGRLRMISNLACMGRTPGSLCQDSLGKFGIELVASLEPPGPSYTAGPPLSLSSLPSSTFAGKGFQRQYSSSRRALG